MNETEIIARLRRKFPRIGDDAAIIGDQAITTDMLVEDVDFTRAIPIEFVARKSLAVNLSDLAAMGARPLHAVVALSARSAEEVERFMDAIAISAQQYEVEIVGGDLSRSEKLVVSIAAIGRCSRPLYRGGAKRGNRVYVSRTLGASTAGLELIRRWSSIEPPRELSSDQREFAEAVIRRHIDPEPEVKLGMALAAIDEVTACIDISDGLSTDLRHLCDASYAGADIERERIPVVPGLATHAGAFGINAQDAALHGGEELALLFTSSLREAELSVRLQRPVYAIGRIVAEAGVRLDGEALEPHGWDHFG